MEENKLPIQPKKREFDLEARLIRFAVAVLKLIDHLPKKPALLHILQHLGKASSSPALNYGEAQSAESQADFIHKMKVALKELRETMNCLRIIDLYLTPNSTEELQTVKTECNELIAIFVTSVRTAEINKRK